MWRKREYPSEPLQVNHPKRGDVVLIDRGDRIPERGLVTRIHQARLQLGYTVKTAIGELFFDSDMVTPLEG